MARIAVIGAGHIGGTLGDAWRRAGHEVVFGVREPQGRQEHGRRFVSPHEAVEGADVVLFAVPGAAMDQAVGALERDLAGKIVIDASNRVGAAKVRSGACEDIANNATPVFRAFNSLGWENFANPRFGEEAADLFYAGPDPPPARSSSS